MRYFKIITIAISCFLLGAFSHQYNPLHQKSIEFFKRHILQKKIKFDLVAYNHGDHIFLDRNYSESHHPKELDKSFLVKTNRHANGTLFIRVMDELTLHRLISPKNNNQGYFDWVISSSETRVDATGVKHDLLISKVFKKGTYRISLGGPFSADPIFISHNDLILTEHFSILN